MLKKKRMFVCAVILAAIVSSSVVCAVAHSSLDLYRQFFLTAAGVSMFAMVWSVYFDLDLTRKSVSEIIFESILMALASIMTTYVTVRFATGLLEAARRSDDLLTNSVSSVIPGVALGTLGFLWAAYCDDMFRSTEQ